MSGRLRITKREWYQLGGLKNPRLFRVDRYGYWEYYRDVSWAAR